MKKIKAGIIGMGGMGASHIEVVRRIGFAEVVAVTDTNYALAQKKARDNYIPKCYKTVEELLADPEITLVHNCTPNHLHTQINEQIIKAGKHLLSEKPLATSSKDSAYLVGLLEQHPDVMACVNFLYRMNSQVMQARAMVQNGEIGDVRLIHGCYLQDWLLYDTDYNWRIEPEFGGPSRVVADIGSHWMDMAQVVTGEKIVSVCADLVTLLPVRKKCSEVVEVFKTATGGTYEDKAITTEDYGAVMFRMTGGISGVYYVSQISAGHGCFNTFEVNGSKASLSWNQERGDELWIGRREEPNALSLRNPANLDASILPYTSLSKGHPEGWNDTFKNSIQSFYNYIYENKQPSVDPAPFATFADAHYIVRLTEAIIQSSKTHAWVDIEA